MIIIYSIPNCKHCEEAKIVLKEKNIEYIEYNLKAKENREIREHYRSLGAKLAPIIICRDGESILWTLIDYKKRDLLDLLEE
jgi:glutaredoxin